jgi:hypothetical protein
LAGRAPVLVGAGAAVGQGGLGGLLGRAELGEIEVGGWAGRLAAEVEADACWERGALVLAGMLPAAEATTVLRRHAEAVVDVLGLDPSAAVRDLQTTLLRGTHRPGAGPAMVGPAAVDVGPAVLGPAAIDAGPAVFGPAVVGAGLAHRLHPPDGRSRSGTRRGPGGPASLPWAGV